MDIKTGFTQIVNTVRATDPDCLKALARGQLGPEVANTPSLWGKVLDVRQRTYGALGWETEPTDKHDHHSTSLVTLQGDEAIGSVRITHRQTDDGARHELPLEHWYKDPNTRNVIGTLDKNNVRYAEIGRLGVPHSVERQLAKRAAAEKGLDTYSISSKPNQGKLFGNSMPYIMTLLGVGAYTELSNIGYLLYVTDPKTAKGIGHLARMEQIGPYIEYKEKPRAAFIINGNDIGASSAKSALIRGLYNIALGHMKQHLRGENPRQTSDFGAFDSSPQVPLNLLRG